jgi:uncharacterized protein YcbK (DUF882 family)
VTTITERFVPVGKARKDPIRTATRTTKRLALAAVFVVMGAKGLHTASANGDTRTITLHHTHRGDDITVTFKRNGRYDEEGLKKLNNFLRDWRTDDATVMDPQLFDAVWEVQRELGDKPIHIISSYRSPRTNEMLRKRSSGVARHSLHMQGKAMDFFIPGVPLERVREAGLRLQRGGVGFYPTSGSPFVHMDVGNVRHWPRMTREQLAKVFPDGRTVHLPTDGKPLAGFAIAQAEIDKRASSPSTFEAARVAANEKKSNPIAKLFGIKPKPAADDEDDSETPSAAPAAPSRVANAATPRARDNIFAGLIPTKPEVKLEPAQAPAAAPEAKPESKPVPVAAIPVPKSRPMPPASPAANQVAAAQPAPAASGFGTYTLAGIGDIFSARGYWQGLPEQQPERDNRQVASADASTGSIGPFAAPPGYGDGKPREGSLAYASPAIEPENPQRPKTGAAPMPRAAAVSANTTIASKGRTNAPTEVVSAPAWAELKEWQLARLEGPWVRALIMTPSVARFMSTTLYGIQDYRGLRPLLATPTEVVLMAFGAEPNPGLSHVRFEGRAIEFPATATFRPGRNTAALR